jgi:hypothetical protein
MTQFVKALVFIISEPFDKLGCVNITASVIEDDNALIIG